MGEDSFSARNESRSSPTFSNGAFDIVALAASAGGLRALSQVLAALPAKFPAAIVERFFATRRRTAFTAKKS